jgi:hypothetical protein
MARDLDSELSKNLVVQLGKDIPTDSPLFERLGILAEAKLL